MSTNIDSLQIEIQTNSSNAGAGIDALAASLERLKKVGSLNTVVKSLNGLSTALQNMQAASSASSSLQTLAAAMESLKGAGALGSIGSSIEKLGTSLMSLQSVNVESIAPQIKKIAEAVAPLSNIKAGGLNSMMTGLQKLSEVTKSLDDDTIAEFVSRVKKLDQELGPLSKKMTTVATAFNAVSSNSKKTTDNFGGLGRKVNTTTFNMSNMINVIRGIATALRPVIDLMKNAINEAIEWDGIAQRFGRGFDDQAQDTYSWIQELNQEMGINTQQFMQYSSTYATMLKGFGVAAEDASKMALGYMELTYDVWSGYNDIYKSLDDAATAVRSAIAGEVEPVRKAGFTIIESTLEQTAANHGLKISLEKATEAQKSYLRYLTLVDQAKAQNLVGNYAREMNTAEGVMRTFNQQLKSLGQTFGSIFLPILVKVMPWLQAFIDLVGDAIMAVANFFNIDIQKVDFSSSIGGSADSATESVEGTTAALKELKNATTGIDELNIISPQSSGGSASGSNASFESLDVDSLWDRSIFDQIQFDVDVIKDELKQALSGVEAVLGVFSMAIGTILVLSGSNIPVGLGLMGVGAAGLAHSIASSWDGMSQQLADTLTTLTSIVGGFLLALGALFAFTGANVGLGIGMMVVGAASIGSAVSISWNFLEGDLKRALSILTTIVSAGALALGAVLAFSGAKVGLGIALMVAGAMGIVTASALNWDSLSDPTRKAIGAIGAIAGGGLLAIGLIIALTGGALPIGIGLMVAGAASLVSSVALNWGGLTGDLKNTITTITSIVGGALIGVGAILAFTGVALPLGIAMIAAGAVGIIAAAPINWNSVLNSIKNVLKEIGAAVGAALLALGILLVCTGVGIPLGIGLIAAGATSLVAGVVLNSEAIKTTIKNGLNAIGDWVKQYGLLAVGVILCLTGVGIPIGIGLIKKGLGTQTASGSTVGDELLKTIKGKWTEIQNWWKKNVKFTIPSLSLKVTYETSGLGTIKKAIVNALGLQGWPKISFAANGGIFDTGSLVWAGEAGPEVVANAGGGKTGVMNVQQMSEAVYEGVYSAVVAAMRANGGNGGGQAVNVYLDSKQITASVEQRQKERGASLMGSQVYSY